MNEMYYNLFPDESYPRKIESTFEFIDVDGNKVKGHYCNDSIMGLLENLSDAITDKTNFHSTKNPSDFCNGIIDVTKPLIITICSKSIAE